MDVITYSLKDNRRNSDLYYSTVAHFTDEVLAEANELLQPAIEKYYAFFKKKSAEGNVSRQECILEILISGVLWRVYSGDSMGLEDGPRHFLDGLNELRKHSGSLKPGVDFFKGIMSTLFLSPDLYDNVIPAEPSIVNYDKLIRWLAATGEFKQEVKRLSVLKSYLETLPSEETVDLIASSIVFSLWFELRSEEALGIFTRNVDKFLNEERPRHYWREDVIFCGRRRVEYHLNMVGAEIMNRAFRKRFLLSKRKMLLLPACMRLLPSTKCMSVPDEMGFRCTGCSSSCQVNQLSQWGRMVRLDVLMVPHESSISSQGEGGSLFDMDVGIIGVSCVLNLISGGWMLKDMGVPAQCVLLDYCGCKNHWHEEGFPTEINTEKLKQILCLES